MPFISKRRFDDLQRAGNRMCNLCFNLSQSKSQQHAGTMEQSYKEWDAAMDKIRQEFIARGSK